MQIPRRRFIQNTAIGAGGLLLSKNCFAATVAPNINPFNQLRIAWTNKLPWDRILDVTSVAGASDFWDERVKKAQQNLVGLGGGVLFFPPGIYRFQQDIRLQNGVTLRGTDPETNSSALDEKYAPRTCFEFPKYTPLFSGNGTPISTAFKGIILEAAASAGNCGLVNLDINRGYLSMGEAEDHKCGANRFVFGCVFRNSAGAESSIPLSDGSQPAWLRYTAKFRAAIRIHASENALVANNRIPRSGDDNFTFAEYPLKDRSKKIVPFEVVFDYDNRPGIYVNHHCIGGAGGEGNDGTPETHPWGFRKGCIIRDNYVWCTGRCAIGFSGDGVICSRNTIRFAKDVFRPTVTGAHVSYGSSTNDNRAMEMRGWRWMVEENDYEVYSNWCSDRKYRINDGEGLMHEDHCNSTIVDSRLVNNRGNSYLSLFHCGSIEGLHIEGNDISTPGNISDIYVTAPRHKKTGDFPVRRVTIVNNTTRSNGIRIQGSPASDNIIKGNQHQGAKPGILLNEAGAVLQNNTNYDVKA